MTAGARAQSHQYAQRHEHLLAHRENRNASVCVGSWILRSSWWRSFAVSPLSPLAGSCYRGSLSPWRPRMSGPTSFTLHQMAVRCSARSRVICVATPLQGTCITINRVADKLGVGTLELQVLPAGLSRARNNHDRSGGAVQPMGDRRRPNSAAAFPHAIMILRETEQPEQSWYLGELTRSRRYGPAA